MRFVLFVEGVEGSRGTTTIHLLALGKIEALDDLTKQLLSLVLILRTGPWVKA